MKTLLEISKENPKLYAEMSVRANAENKSLSVSSNNSLVMTELPPPSTSFLAAQIRSQRDALLAKSDWTQAEDSPLSSCEKEKWRQYRQFLRDIPTQKGFPENVVWK